MDIASAQVTHRLVLELIDSRGSSVPLPASLSYDARDPYAVVASFDTGDSKVRWVFARDLLATGVHEPTGDGDVHVWPCLDAFGRAVTILELTSPDGEALMQARSGDVCAFLRRTESLVRRGCESELVDVDSAIAQILA